MHVRRRWLGEEIKAGRLAVTWGLLEAIVFKGFKGFKAGYDFLHFDRNSLVQGWNRRLLRSERILIASYTAAPPGYVWLHVAFFANVYGPLTGGYVLNIENKRPSEP
jgi:hypothetical protein